MTDPVVSGVGFQKIPNKTNLNEIKGIVLSRPARESRSLKEMLAKNQEIFKNVLFLSDQDSFIVFVIKLVRIYGKPSVIQLSF